MFVLKALLLLSIVAVAISSECCDSDSVCCPKGWLGYNGNCYRYFTYRKTWSDARAHCRTLGADLVSIHSPAENNVINGLVSGEEVWIGFNDLEVEDQFSWSDGTSAIYTAWQTNEPNDSGNAEDCGELNYSGHPDGTWNDEGCDYQRSYVCKK